MTKRIPEIDILLKENQKFKIGNLDFTIIFIPGHARPYCFLLRKRKNCIHW